MTIYSGLGAQQRLRSKYWRPLLNFEATKTGGTIADPEKIFKERNWSWGEKTVGAVESIRTGYQQPDFLTR